MGEAEQMKRRPNISVFLFWAIFFFFFFSLKVLIAILTVFLLWTLGFLPGC